MKFQTHLVLLTLLTPHDHGRWNRKLRYVKLSLKIWFTVKTKYGNNFPAGFSNWPNFLHINLGRKMMNLPAVGDPFPWWKAVKNYTMMCKFIIVTVVLMMIIKPSSVPLLSTGVLLKSRGFRPEDLLDHAYKMRVGEVTRFPRLVNLLWRSCSGKLLYREVLLLNTHKCMLFRN